MNGIGITNFTIGILAFLISSVLAYLKVVEFKESQETIKIKHYSNSFGEYYDRSNFKYGFLDNQIVGGISVKNLNIFLVVDLEYFLVNSTNKPITITDISYIWYYPIFDKKFIGEEMIDFLTNGYYFYSEVFKDPWDVEKNPIPYDFVIKPGKRILMKDRLHASPVINNHFINNRKEWRKSCNCNINSNFEPHDLPPSYGIKVIATDIKGRIVEMKIINRLWERKETN